MDQFEEVTKQTIQNYSYVADIEKQNEEDRFDVEELLAGIPDEDLDEESKIAKRKAMEKKLASQDNYNKTRTLADVL